MSGTTYSPAAFTAGPWRFGYFQFVAPGYKFIPALNHPDGEELVLVSGAVVDGEICEEVGWNSVLAACCAGYGGEVSLLVNDANAALIMAAPDLYAELSNLVAIVENGDKATTASLSYRSAVAALAKARGTSAH